MGPIIASSPAPGGRPAASENFCTQHPITNGNEHLHGVLSGSWPGELVDKLPITTHAKQDPTMNRLPNRYLAGRTNRPGQYGPAIEGEELPSLTERLVNLDARSGRDFQNPPALTGPWE